MSPVIRAPSYARQKRPNSCLLFSFCAGCHASPLRWREWHHHPTWLQHPRLESCAPLHAQPKYKCGNLGLCLPRRFRRASADPISEPLKIMNSGPLVLNSQHYYDNPEMPVELFRGTSAPPSAGRDVPQKSFRAVHFR